jgi:hypothetical protein
MIPIIPQEKPDYSMYKDPGAVHHPELCMFFQYDFTNWLRTSLIRSQFPSWKRLGSMSAQ